MKKRRLISAALSFALVTTSLPAIPSFAAAPSIDFQSDTTMYLGETYDFDGFAIENGSDIDTIHVKIEGPERVPIAYFRETGLGVTEYDFSDIPSFTWGDILSSVQSNTDITTSTLGDYEITVFAKDEDGNTAEYMQTVTLENYSSTLIDDYPLLSSPEMGSVSYVPGDIVVYSYAEENITSDANYKIRWDDICDYYSVHIRALSGNPDPGNPSEAGKYLDWYTITANDEYSKTNLTIEQEDLATYSNRYWKIAIQGFDSNGDYSYRCDQYVYVTEVITNPFSYEFNDDNATITIVKYNGNGGDIVIPDTIEGYPVTAIGEKAFYFCTNLSNIVISEGIETIHDMAFVGCTNLKNINLPDSLKTIANGTFQSCENLSSI